MIFVSVGTFIQGFDDLIAAMDATCTTIGVDAFAQIGNSSITPRHMRYKRFLTTDEMQTQLQNSRLVVCHGGLGIIGDAMRANKPIIAVPRQNTFNSTSSPANNQLAVVQRLQALYGISTCNELSQIQQLVLEAIESNQSHRHYNLHSNIPDLIANYLGETL